MKTLEQANSERTLRSSRKLLPRRSRGLKIIKAQTKYLILWFLRPGIFEILEITTSRVTYVISESAVPASQWAIFKQLRHGWSWNMQNRRPNWKSSDGSCRHSKLWTATIWTKAVKVAGPFSTASFTKMPILSPKSAGHTKEKQRAKHAPSSKNVRLWRR